MERLAEFNKIIFNKNLIHFLIRFLKQRLIDTEKVTCIKWLPNSENQFLVSHSSGQLYLYKEDLACDAKSPNYQFFKSGDGYSIYTCKTKSTQNPLFRWVIGDGSLNEFAFSPCGKYLGNTNCVSFYFLYENNERQFVITATVSQDGFLRVFDHNTMDLVGRLRSYFGGLLCVCWSPDSRLIATGGEDDLVTVWSFVEKRVIAKGRGHKSWVSVVAFDSFTTSLDGFNKIKDAISNDDDDDSLDEQKQTNKQDDDKKSTQTNKNKDSKLKTKNKDQTDDKACSTCINNCSTNCPNRSTQNGIINTYRLASVGQDTQLCFWEISEDILKQSIVKSRTSILSPTLSNHQSPTITDATATTSTPATNNQSNITNQHQDSTNTNSENKQSTSKEKVQSQATNLKAGFLNLNLTNGLNSTTSSNSSNLSSNKSTINASFHKSDHPKKEHKRNFSLNSKHHSDKNQNKQQNKTVEDPVKLLGTPICPRLEDVVKLEPLVCKKISHERLSSLTFCEDCFVVACHDVSTWARPNFNNQSPSVLYDMIDELVNENGTVV